MGGYHTPPNTRPVIFDPEAIRQRQLEAIAGMTILPLEVDIIDITPAQLALPAPETTDDA